MTSVEPLRIGSALFDWGSRTFVMGILNATPDSFSGDGLLARSHPDAVGSHADAVERAVAQARAMVADGADLLDAGGESTRPGHTPVDAKAEVSRVVPIVAALRRALPEVPLSIDTTKVAVAEAALDAGADIVNDIWGVAADDALLRLAADRGVPIVLMHNRVEPRYTSLIDEILEDLRAAIERALAAGIAWSRIVVDPGFGFGKTPAQNILLLRELARLRELDRPVLLGTSRKSTLGLVLDLPADQRLEATIATTVLGIAAGVDLVRVHDVRDNVRAARMADAVLRGPLADLSQAARPISSEPGGTP